MSYGYYLVQLSYTADALAELSAWAASVKAPMTADRLASVERLIKELGGRIVDIDSNNPDGPEIRGKLVGCSVDDLVAIIWFPSHMAALAFKIAVAAEPGVRSIHLTPLMPMNEALEAMKLAGYARTASGYSAPGGGKTSWKEPAPTTAKAAAKPAKGKSAR